MDSRPRPSCVDGSGQRQDPLVPPAPAAGGWVLLEHAGPWGPDAAADSPLVPAEVRAAVAERGLRLNLIRRHRRCPDSGTVTCFLASFRSSTGPHLERLCLSDSAELVGGPLDALAEGRPSRLGTPVTDPLYLVCTHGRVETCCARLGRPVARALTAAVGDRAWETTHVGGCRFAANLVCLPDGILYGRVGPRDVATVVRQAEAGRIALPWFRGSVAERAPHPFVADG
jgi:hypothetical protein